MTTSSETWRNDSIPDLGSRELPLVSVVTPFYNTAQYLDEAIRSVLSQSYGNFEYILADNCSTDGSLQIAQRYASIDRRVRVFTHAEFLEQDPNYNRALGYISAFSRYCKIVQADDWIFPNCLSEMVALAETDSRIALVSCCYLYGDLLAGGGLPFSRNRFTGREACRTRLLKGGTFFGSPTNLLYRSDTVRRRVPFFAPNEVSADTACCFEILEDADFSRVPQILAFLRVTPGSIWDRFRALQADSFNAVALLNRYGQRFLAPEEFRARSKAVESEYVRMLARAAVLGASSEFWDFHSTHLARIGRSLPRMKIAVYAIDFILDKILNPRRSLHAIVEKLGSRSPTK